MNQRHFSPSRIALAVLLAAAPMAAWAATAPSLGTASSFAALGGAGVTCTSPIPALPAITVTGDVGSLLAAPSSVTGFPGFTPGALPCSLSGTVVLGASAAHADFMTAYNTLASNLPADGNVCPSGDPTHNLVGDIGTQTLSPGVYCITGVATLTGQLTLDLTASGGGDGSGVWVFKGDSSLTPIGGATPELRSKVVMANGGDACNVYWQLGTAATFVNTDFVGNVLAGSNITFAGSTLAGRALASIESVTMTGSSITSCGATGGNGNGNGNGEDGDHDGDNGHHHGHDKDKHHGHDKDKHHGHDKDKHHDHDDDKGHGSYLDNPYGKHESKRDRK